MAFQRPFLISLKRQDSHLRWGFGIKGGKDYGEPLVVQTVGEDSLAENFGLREGDEVIQVGRVNVQDLTLGQVHELLARCGNKIEMFVVREDLLSPRKGKEPQVVRTVVHNPYNSPLSLYSTENIAETLAKQTEVLTEGQVSTEEDEGPEKLSFKEKSAVFQLLEEQAKQEGPVPARTAVQQTVQVKKPTAAPPPPPKPKPPSNEQIFNGYDHHQVDHQKTSRIEYQTTQKVVSQYQYQQEEPVQYQQQSSVYQYQTSPGYQSPTRENVQAPVYQSSVSFQGKQSPTPSYQQQNQSYQQQKQNYQQPKQSYQQPNQNYQQSNQNYQQSNQNYQGHQSSVNISQQQYPGYQSPTYQPLNQINYQQSQQTRPQGHQTQVPCTQQSNYQKPKPQPSQTAVSKAEIKVGPPPPPRSASTKQPQYDSSMAAVYKQQYEQHLQKQYEQQQQMMLNAEEETMKPKAHIIEGDIFEHNCTSGTPITYKTPPAAPPKPHWPPPPPQHERFRSPQPLESPPNGLRNAGQVWPPKKSSAVELPRTGFNPAAVREQGGNGRRCVWPPPGDEHRSSGRNTPQSPVTGRRIQWNPSPSPPTTRRTTYSSPSRRKDVQWPPPAGISYENQNGGHRPSPRLSRKAKFDDYIHEHASINVPQTYRPPPGTQHIEFR